MPTSTTARRVLNALNPQPRHSKLINVTHNNRQAIINTHCHIGQTLTLIPDPHNPAIIHAAISINGQTTIIGDLKPELATTLNPNNVTVTITALTGTNITGVNIQIQN